MSDETPKLRAGRECDAAGHETVYCLCDMYDAEADGYRRGIDKAVAAITLLAAARWKAQHDFPLPEEYVACLNEDLLDRKGGK